MSGGAEMGKVAERGDLVNKFRIWSQMSIGNPIDVSRRQGS